MKKNVLSCAVIILLFISISSDAKIHRLGYPGVAISGVDYYTLQNANDSTSAGDTIYVYPGNYYSATLNKKLTWIGYGYFLTGTNPNTNLQSLTGPLVFSAYVYAGGSGSVFEGLDGFTIYAYYQNSVNNLIIKRCNGAVYFDDQPCDGWQISQCYLSALTYEWGGGNITNLNVSNCYINGANFSNMGTTVSAQLINCVVTYSYYGNGSGKYATVLLKNTIFLSYHSYDNNVVYQNCIGTSDGYPTPSGNGNKNVTSAQMVASVFVGYSTQGTYSNDGAYMLTASSPAKGAGVGGVDDGIYGGPNPYRLSGIPPVPTFYKISATSTSVNSNPYTITISVRSNN